MVLWRGVGDSYGLQVMMQITEMKVHSDQFAFNHS